MKQTILAFVFGVAVVAGSGLAQTQSPDLKSLEKEAKNIDADTSKLSSPDRPFEILSKQLGVPVETLKSEKESTNFGFGELFIANSLAKASGKTFDQIAQEFKQDQGWGAVAKANNLKLGPLVSGLKQASKSMKQEQRNEMAAQRRQADQLRGNASRGAGKGPKK